MKAIAWILTAWMLYYIAYHEDDSRIHKWAFRVIVLAILVTFGIGLYYLVMGE